MGVGGKGKSKRDAWSPALHLYQPLRAAALLSLETAGSQGGGCEAGDGSMCVRHLVEHVCVGGAEGEGSMCGTDVQPAL